LEKDDTQTILTAPSRNNLTYLLTYTNLLIQKMTHDDDDVINRDFVKLFNTIKPSTTSQ